MTRAFPLVRTPAAADRNPRAVSPDCEARNARRGMALLFAVGVLSLLDRNILLVLQEPIRTELGLNDAQLGALTGLSFAVVYSLFALPVARLADRGVRKRIVGTAVVVWSAMTGLSAFAGSFVVLAGLRMGVAAGEAGSVPASHSMISDYYPPAQRPAAYALWTLSNPLGTSLGLLLGGLLAAHVGWRGTLLTLGAIGLALGPLVLLLKEPARGRFDAAKAREVAPTSLWQALRLILGIPAIRLLLAGAAVQSLVAYAVGSWTASFYVRLFGLPIDRVGFYVSIIAGGGAVSALGLGAFLMRRLGSRDARWNMRVPAIGALIFVPFSVVQLMSSSLWISLGAAFVAAVAGGLFGICTVVTSQSLVPGAVRATMAAVLALACNLLGLALGPLTVGLVSDWLIANRGMADDSLRYALLVPLLLAPVAAALFYRAAVAMHPSRPVDR